MTALAFREHVLLADRTTLRVGGPARYWLDADDPSTILRALRWAQQRGVSLQVLGGGSNVLVADRGFDGLVIRVGAAELHSESQGDDVLVDVGAGVRWDDFVRWAVDQQCAGVECLAGIPGDVGAAPIQNIGAYGQEVGQCIEQVDAIDQTNGTRVRIDQGDCDFRYRRSVFKDQAADRYIVLGVRFRLRRGGSAMVSYPGLERTLAGRRPTLAAVREAVLSNRRDKSMVWSDDDENRRSAGSFFVNPLVSSDQAAEVLNRVRGLLASGQSMPAHPINNGQVKLSAAWLIERAGLGKGTVRGRVGLSTRHCLAIINRGGATASDVLAFAIEIRAQVRDRFGVDLDPEPRLIGFEPRETAPLFD